MTDIMKIRRVGFEAWAEIEGVRTHHSGHPDVMTAVGGACWSAYNAALDSVVVKLPRPWWVNEGDCVVDLEECREAIHAAGVRTI